MLQINLQENPLKSFLLSLFLSNLRRSVPQDQQDNYLFVTQNFELIRDVRSSVLRAGESKF